MKVVYSIIFKDRLLLKDEFSTVTGLEGTTESYAFFLIFSSRFMWIGLLRGSADESFAWVNDPYPPLYSNWALGEPNNFYGRGENCGHMYIWTSQKGKQWNDELCVNPSIGPMVFMCEIQPLGARRIPENYKIVESPNVVDGEESGDQSGSGELSYSGNEFGFSD